MSASTTDWTSMDLRVASINPLRAVDREATAERLRLTAAALAQGLLLAPAVVLLVLTIVSIPLVLVAGVGSLLLALVVPGTALLTRVPRVLAGSILGERIEPWYADSGGRNVLTRPVAWMRDPARWRDFGWLAFASTGGAALSLLPAALLSNSVTWLVMMVLDPSWFAMTMLLVLSGPLLVAWWLVTPALVRARAVADRAILGPARVEQLERRVSEVTTTRAETLDHAAAEIRRIERDLHDGAQARIVSAGMTLGLAEQLMDTDPEAATTLMREARASTVSALSDLRTVVRGIRPPALADRGLVGGVEALVADLPFPVTLVADDPAPLPVPLESAAYFAIAECLANTAKHAAASSSWVRIRRDPGRLRVEVGDDGRGGAVATGSGLAGVARRLAAFDGTMAVSSPTGGPTVVALELPVEAR